jgi:hypothetical protein
LNLCAFFEFQIKLSPKHILTSVVGKNASAVGIPPPFSVGQTTLFDFSREDRQELQNLADFADPYPGLSPPRGKVAAQQAERGFPWR